MADRQIRITSGSVSRVATLAETPTAHALWEALPVTARANRWGAELYFQVPVDLAEEPSAAAEVAVGAVAYWPPGAAMCVFWGPTPASLDETPRAASPVNVIAHVASDPAGFDAVASGALVTVERV